MSDPLVVDCDPPKPVDVLELDGRSRPGWLLCWQRNVHGKWSATVAARNPNGVWLVQVGLDEHTVRPRTQK